MKSTIELVEAYNLFAAPPLFEDLKVYQVSHPALQEIKKFGKNFHMAALSRKDLKTFFATLWHVLKETHNNIEGVLLKCASQETHPNSSNLHIEKADSLKESHHFYHQLFKQMINHLGVREEDLLKNDYILPAGVSLRNLSYKFCTQESSLSALSFFHALQLYTLLSFKYVSKGLKEHHYMYSLTEKEDLSLGFFSVENHLETAYLTQLERSIKASLKEDLHYQEALKGITSLLEAYECMFVAFNQHFYS